MNNSKDITLELISGTVKNLHIESGKMNFLLSEAGKSINGIASAGAAAIGSFFSSAIILTAVTNNEPAKLFTFLLGDLTIQGCFNSIAIEEGDKVEVVVYKKPEDQTQAVAYAVRVVEKRHLWVAPMMSSGHAGMSQLAIRLPLTLIVFLFPFTFIVALLITFFNEGSIYPFFESWQSHLLSYGIANLIIFIVGGFALYFTFIGKARIGTKIIAALGYEQSEKVNLQEISDKTQKVWEEKHGKPFPTINDEFVFYY